MKGDLSKYVHDIYPTLKDKKVKFKLKDGTQLIGVITGFFYNDVSINNKLIHSWQIVQEDAKCAFGSDTFGYNNGIIILQSIIAEIYFFDNNKTLIF